MGTSIKRSTRSASLVDEFGKLEISTDQGNEALIRSLEFWFPDDMVPKIEVIRIYEADPRDIEIMAHLEPRAFEHSGSMWCVDCLLDGQETTRFVMGDTPPSKDDALWMFWSDYVKLAGATPSVPPVL